MSQNVVYLFKKYCLTKKQIIVKIFNQEEHKAAYGKETRKSAFRQMWLTKNKNVPLNLI